MAVFLRRRKGKRGISIFLSWWAWGKWNYEFLKLRLIGDKARDKQTLRLAEKMRLNREEELESMGHGTVPAYKRRTPFIQYFKAICHDNSVWENCLAHLKAFPGGMTSIGNINESWALHFRDFLLERVSANSAHLNFVILKAALNQAVKDRIILYNPANMVEKIKKTETEIGYLTQPELEVLASTPCPFDPELKRAFLFCCFIGLRFSDVKALKWENYEDGKLKFRQRKTGGFEYLPLPSPAEELLKANKLNVPLIFKLKSQVQTNKNLRKWAAAAGIKKHLHFHMSRHTAATRLLEEGADLYVVSKILGHKSISTTQRYAKVTGTKMAEALNRLPNIMTKES